MTQVKDYPGAQGTAQQTTSNPRKIRLTPKSGQSSLEIVLVGDTSFGENYQQKLEDTGRDNILKSEGYDYPLAKMKAMLTEADLVVANLETPLTDIKISPFADKKSYVHWSDIAKAPEHLLKHNINVVSLANNHTFDYGKDGFKQTLDVLEQQKIHYFGAGRTQQEANEPFFIEGTVAGQTFSCAIIGAFQESTSYRRDFQAYADRSKEGVNPLNIDTMIKNIRAIKAYNPDTFVIVFPHWGYNYEWKSTAQTDQAKALIDNGADLILGHGAHMLQELESYRNKWIAYSIGNFMFNSPGRYEHYKAPPYSLLAKLIVEAGDEGLSLTCRLYPIVTDNKQTQYQTTFVTDQQFNEVCQFLTNKNTSTSTLLHGLPRNKDQYGAYLALDITTQPTTIASPSPNMLGYVCNVREGVTPGKKAKKWMYRALSMSQVVKEMGLELFIYAYNHTDLETGTVKGYVIENGQFIEKTAPVPQINYDWFLGPKVNLYNRHINYAQFSDWAEKNNRTLYPHRAYMSLAKDKLLSFKTISEFDVSLGIPTEPYNTKLGQLERFINNRAPVFLKPQFGSSGIGIIVIKKNKDQYSLSHYDLDDQSALSFNSLSTAYEYANKIIGKEAYIIQNGIQTRRINGSTFDIRLLFIGERESWDIISEVRLGAKDSYLSNVSQGGTCIELDELLNQLTDTLKPEQFKNVLIDKLKRLTRFLDAYNPAQMMEIAYDVILDTEGKMFITEINCKPGSPMIFTSFNNILELSEEERQRYTKYIQPHGRSLANTLYRRWQTAQTHQKAIWFDTHTTPLSLEASDKTTLLHELYHALQQKRALNPDNIPSHLVNDTSPRIVFLSVSNGFSKAQVALSSGNGIITALQQVLTKLPVLHKEYYTPIWIKLDIVTDAVTRNRVDLNKPLMLQRSLTGLAFSQDIGMAFLPEELNANTLVTSSDNLQRRNIKKYVASNPFLADAYEKIKDLDHATLYEFKTISLFYDGEVSLPLYRGHRMIKAVTTEMLLDSVDSAVDYLIRSVDLEGKFKYSYEPKIDKDNTSYNILRHSGTLYSMLEVYELTRDDSVLTAAQRALRFLINQMQESTVKDEQTLVVVEGGFVKLGGNGLAALALAKYIHLTQDQSYLPTLQKLGAWIVNTQTSEGHFTIHKQVYNAEIITGFDSEYYPGEALFALARIYQLDPQPRWLRGAVNGALYLINVRDKGIPDAKLNHDHWLLYALNEIHRLETHEDFLIHAMKITNAIIKSQRTQSPYPDWVGSYYSIPRSTPGATRMEGLCASYCLARDYINPEQVDKILSALKLGIPFQLQTQFHPESVMYLPNPQRSLGGFHGSLTNFEIRIDYVQHNISCLLGYYRILKST